ncbi:hypothetical protein K491DRAFT_705981 [Lophiostoma macrostomum CBS 122681]|uniref:Methyltransferase-domain-containing protein n=1 Tax=Lophiostoma macrostomum CBS 122681 TaxID=1314788 RepID=A0A6A6T0H9_9PLEO|nr:hypothetical protein K491DRAFT_705981 [Lophiostoma macrostomum CBS 122681]
MDAETLSVLAILRRQYFQLVEPAALKWPPSDLLKAPDVQSWIFSHLFQESNISSPPPETYRKRILKNLIAKLEAAVEDPEEDEISDDLMSAFSTLMGSALLPEAESAQQKAFVTYNFPHLSIKDENTKESPVTLLEARSVISSSGTTGLRTWEAALVLGSYLTSEAGKSVIQGQDILELGAGTGMLSVLCAKYLGVNAVVATDGDEAVVDAIKTNAFLNGLDSDESNRSVFRTAALRWGFPINASTFQEDYGMEVPGIILGADVTYDRSVIPRLVATLREFFDSNAALQILVSATIRNEQTFETFLNACRRHWFGLEQVDYPLTPERLQEGPFYPTMTPIQIWRITIGGHDQQDIWASQ